VCRVPIVTAVTELENNIAIYTVERAYATVFGSRPLVLWPPPIVVVGSRQPICAHRRHIKRGGTCRDSFEDSIRSVLATDDCRRQDPSSNIAMNALSGDARSILNRMEPKRRYEVPDLRGFAPDISAESLLALMHELWINRLVERVGQSAWQRYRSVPDHNGALNKRSDAVPRSAFQQTEVVRPEDLFDHDAFRDFFR